MMAQSNGMADNSGAQGAAFQDDERLIELVGFLVQGIVAHPEEVEVEEFFDDLGAVYGVRVHDDDTGRVIGREGRVAGALRHLVKAASVKSGAHVTIEILTEDSPLSLIDAEPEAASSPVKSSEPKTPDAKTAPVAAAKDAAPAVEATAPVEAAETPAATKAAPAKAKPKAKPRAKSAGAAAPRRGMMPRGGDQTIGKDEPPATEENSDG